MDCAVLFIIQCDVNLLELLSVRSCVIDGCVYEILMSLFFNNEASMYFMEVYSSHIMQKPQNVAVTISLLLSS